MEQYELSELESEKVKRLRAEVTNLQNQMQNKQQQMQAIIDSTLPDDVNEENITMQEQDGQIILIEDE